MLLSPIGARLLLSTRAINQESKTKLFLIMRVKDLSVAINKLSKCKIT